MKRFQNKPVFLATVFAVVLCILGTQRASADLVDVSFGQTSEGNVSGAAVVGTAGDTWNNLRGNPAAAVAGQPVALTNTAGNPSGLALSVGGVFNGTAEPGGAVLPIYQGNLFLDSGDQYGPPPPSTIVISGFTSNTPQDVYIYSSAIGGGGQGGVFNGVTATNSFSTGDTTYVLGDNYILLSDLVPTGGQISISWTNDTIDGQRFTGLNGLQIESVPEPTSLVAFCGLGAIGLFLVICRQRNT